MDIDDEITMAGSNLGQENISSQQNQGFQFPSTVPDLMNPGSRPSIAITTPTPASSIDGGDPQIFGSAQHRVFWMTYHKGFNDAYTAQRESWWFEKLEQMTPQHKVRIMELIDKSPSRAMALAAGSTMAKLMSENFKSAFDIELTYFGELIQDGAEKTSFDKEGMTSGGQINGKRVGDNEVDGDKDNMSLSSLDEYGGSAGGAKRRKLD